MEKSFSTTGALCGKHATVYQGISPSAELWIRYDDDGWLASHLESGTEWTIDTCDVEPLRLATHTAWVLAAEQGEPISTSTYCRCGARLGAQNPGTRCGSCCTHTV